MESYSKEFRRDVLAACDANQGTKAVALQFKVSESWVRRIKQDRREKGKIAPCMTRNRIPEWARYSEQMQRVIAERPDMTLQELKDELGTELSRSTLCMALKALKLTLKKKSSGRPSRIARMSPSNARHGRSGKSASIRTGSSLSTKPGPKRT